MYVNHSIIISHITIIIYYTIVHILIRIMQTAYISVIDILKIYDSDYIPISWLTGAGIAAVYTVRHPITIMELKHIGKMMSVGQLQA